MSKRWTGWGWGMRAFAALLLLMGALSSSALHAQTTVDLIIVKSGPASILNGEEIVYTLTIVNGGPADANGATFSDTLPTGITNITASCLSATLGAVCPASINIAGQTVSGTIPTLPNSGQVVLEVRGRSPVRAGPTSISNTATITAPVGRTETNPGTNSSTANTSMTYRPADLSTTKTISSPTFNLGDTITYVVEHTNLGPGPANGAAVVDYQQGTAGGGVTGLAFSNRTMICEAFDGAVCPTFTMPPSGTFTTGSVVHYNMSVPTWPVNGRLRFTISYQADSYVGPAVGCGSAARSWRVNNYGRSDINGGLTDPVSTNNLTAAITSQGPSLTQPVCPGADVAVTKTQSSAAWAFNSPQTYTVVHTNNGPGDADGGVIGDQAALISVTGGVASLAFDSAQIVSCTATGGAVCPTSFTMPASGNIGTGFATLYQGAVPTWPNGGVVTVVYQLTPRSYNRSVCSTQPTSTATLRNQGYSRVPAGTTDPVTTNHDAYVNATGVSEPATPCLITDIAITKTQDNAALVFGQPREYSITWTNNGPDAADGTTIRDVLRRVSLSGGVTGFTYNNLAIVSCTTTGGAVCPSFNPAASGSLTSDAGIFSGVVSSWPSGASVTVVYRMTVTGYTGTCTGVARAALRNEGDVPSRPANMNDPVSGNNLGQVTSDLGPICADLAVTKSVAPATLIPSGPIQFTLEVSAPAAATTVTNATLRDVLPAGFLFDGVSAACTVTAGTATCGTFTWSPGTREFASVVPSIAPGGKLQWVLTGQAIDYSSSWFNTATLNMDPAYWDPLSATNSSTVSVNIQGADPKVTKQSIDKQVRPGSPVRYRLTLSNPVDGGTLTGLVLQDTLPSGFTFASTTSLDLIGGVTQTAPGSPTVGSGTPQWGTYQVPAGGVIVIEFVANTPAALACGTTIYNNSARVDYVVSGSPQSRPYDGTLIGNSADDVTVPCPATVTKAYSAYTISSGVNTQLVFTVTPATIEPPFPFPFDFTDALPSALQITGLVSNTCGGTVTDNLGGSLGTGDQGVRLTGGLLPGSGTQSCQLRVNVTNRLGQFNADCSSNPAMFTNGAGNMSGLANVENGVTNQCLVINPVALTLFKSISPTTVLEGETTTVTMTVRNPPGHPATMISFVDTLPSNWQVTSPSNLAGTCSGIGSAVTISGNTVTANSMAVADNTAGAGNLDCTITFTVTHVAGQSNTSCAASPAAWTNGTSNVTGRSANLAYNSAPCMVVSTSPTLNKVISPSSIVDGGVAQLTFTLTNSSLAPAQTGINFLDSLPTWWRVADGVVNNTCGGTVTNSANVALAAGMTSVRLTGGSMAAGQTSCEITVNITNAAGNLNASCASNPSAWTNQNGNVSGLTNLYSRITAPQCLVVTPRPGTITVSKAISSPPAGTPAGDFNVYATCNLPVANTRYPSSGYVTVTTATPGVITGIPFGATCTVTEETTAGNIPVPPAGYAWNAPTYAQPVGTMPAGGNLNATVTNSLRALVGTLQVTKALSLPGGVSGPFSFTFTATCDLPSAGSTYSATLADYPTNNVVNIANVPAGANCVLAESINTAAPAGYSWGAPSIGAMSPAGGMPAGGQQTVTVTNALAANPTVVTITKTVAGAPATGAPGNYDVAISCAAPNAGPFTGTITLVGASTTGSTTINVPATATACAVAETARATAPANYAWSGALPSGIATSPANMSPGGTATATVTNTLTANPTVVTVTKTVTGAPATGAPGSYDVAISCAAPNAGPFTGTITLAGAATTGTTTINVPAAATACSVAETARATAPANYAWSGALPSGIATSPANMSPGGTATATVTNTLTANPTVVTITKTVTGGPASGVPGDYEVEISCAAPNAGPFAGVITLAGTDTTGTTTINVPAAATACAVAETVRPDAPAGYSWTEALPTGIATEPANMSPGGTATATITNPLGTGTLTINKMVSMALPNAATFNFTVACTHPDGTVTPIESANAASSIAMAAGATTGSVTSIGPIAGGSTCTVTETAPAAIANHTWGTTPGPNAGIAITAGAVASTSFTNTLTANPGALTVSKTISGASAAAITADLSFPFTVACQTPAATYSGTVTVNANGTTGNTTVTGIPAGSTSCQITEGTTPAAPVGYRWNTPSYTQPSPDALPAAGSISGEIVNGVTPLDPPFIIKRGRVLNETTIEWTITVINNNPNNAGQAPVPFIVTDPLPAGMTFVAGSVACTPTSAGAAGNATTVSTCEFNGANTALSVTGNLAYTNTASADAATAPERITIVFQGTAAQGALIQNTATVANTTNPNVTTSSTAVIGTPVLPVPVNALWVLLLTAIALSGVAVGAGRRQR